MRPTVKNIYDDAREHAGDNQISGGAVFKDGKLAPFYRAAYADLFRAMRLKQLPRVRRTSYYDLPAYTSYLDPATAGMTDVGEIESVEERGGVAEVAIVSTTAGAAFSSVVTAAPHGMVNGSLVVTFGIAGASDDINNIWSVTVTSSTGLNLNGCTATGNGTGGTLAYSAEEFNPVPLGSVDIGAPVSAIDRYEWAGDILRFPVVNQLRQLRITYSLSGNAPVTPTSTIIAVDDSRDFLAHATAARALLSRGNERKGRMLYEMAYGNRWDSAGETGGLLDQFLSEGVRSLQRIPSGDMRTEPFRTARHAETW